VVIVGGGFGGLYTALALAERPGHPPIVLIEPRRHFLFLPLLYELLSGELQRWEVAPRYDALLAGRGITWLQDRVLRIDTDAALLHTAAGRSLRYSRLVIATGSEGSTFGVPGADRHSLGFRTLEDVERLQALLADLRHSPRPIQRLAVVGAGPTGVELACKLADLVPSGTLIELIELGPTPLAEAKAFNREQALRALERRDVRLRTGTRVTAVTPTQLELAGVDPQRGSTSLAVDGVVWTAGLVFRAPEITPMPALDSRGRLLCESDLRLSGQERVFVAGDLAHIPGDTDAPPPTTAQVAFQQAPLLADNLMRSLAGEPLQSFHWNDLGEMLSLGRGDACLTGSGLTLAGPIAWQLRRLAYLSRLPGFGMQVRAAAGWLAEEASRSR
jgi:NADH dehydrogenase